MSYPFNYPTPQNANIQIFSEPAPTNANGTWVKPQGASFVWFTLIGAGAGGGSSDAVSSGGGGGSGAVTNCMVPAFLIPDELKIAIGAGGAGVAAGGTSATNAGGATKIIYQAKDGTGYTLLTANGGRSVAALVGGSGGLASTSNYFSCIGFYQSIAGDNGGGSASATTFLSGGYYTGTNTANYGYSTAQYGFFQTQPIIVGVGGNNPYPSLSPYVSGKGGTGCGGAGVGNGIGVASGAGGDGLCVIITW